jgi:UPF0271 protein
MLTDGTVVTHSGNLLTMRPASILLHSDTAGAVALAGMIRREIEANGGEIVPVARQLTRRPAG